MAARDLPPTERRLLSLPVAAEILGISLRTLQARISQGALPIVRPSPRRVCVATTDLDAFIAQQRETR